MVLNVNIGQVAKHAKHYINLQLMSQAMRDLK